MPWLSAMNDWRNSWLLNRRKRNEYIINFCGSIAAHWTQHSGDPRGNCGWDCLVCRDRFWLACDWIRAFRQRTMAESPIEARCAIPFDLRNPWELCHCMAGSEPSYGPLTGGRDIGVGAQQSWRCRRMEHYRGSTLVSDNASPDRASHSLDRRKALAHALTLANGCSCVERKAHL